MNIPDKFSDLLKQIDASRSKKDPVKLSIEQIMLAQYTVQRSLGQFATIALMAFSSDESIWNQLFSEEVLLKNMTDAGITPTEDAVEECRAASQAMLALVKFGKVLVPEGVEFPTK